MATVNLTRLVPAMLRTAVERKPLQVAPEPRWVVYVVIQDQAGQILPGD